MILSNNSWGQGYMARSLLRQHLCGTNHVYMVVRAWLECCGGSTCGMSMYLMHRVWQCVVCHQWLYVRSGTTRLRMVASMGVDLARELCKDKGLASVVC